MIKVKIPASTANIGPGFDVFGMALDLYNYVSIDKSEKPGINIIMDHNGNESLLDPKKNLVCIAANRLWQEAGFKADNINIELKNHVPISRGLGSSATAIVGGLVAANAWADNPLTKDQIRELAVEIEGHPDNVCPALYGGFIAACRKDDGITRMIQVDLPKELRIVVAIPDFYLSTKVARRAMPTQVSIKDAVFNIQRAALLLGAAQNGDLELWADMMEDKLHQPYRFPLIKGADKVLTAAKKAGALGTALSGAGPTLMALCNDNSQAVADAMHSAWLEKNVENKSLVLKPDILGATLI